MSSAPLRVFAKAMVLIPWETRFAKTSAPSVRRLRRSPFSLSRSGGVRKKTRPAPQGAPPPLTHADVDAAQPEGPYLPQLILGESLRRVDEQRPARGAHQGVLEGRYLVAERLAARRRCRHHDVLPGAYPLVGLALVGIEALDTYLR